MIVLAAKKCDQKILASLTKLAKVSTELQEILADCVHFVFSKPKHIANLASQGHGLATGMFWHTFGQLLIFCVKTEAAAVSKLTDSLLWSIASDNELAMASAGRSLIEHAATTYVLAEKIRPLLNRLKDDVWPAISTSSLPDPPPTSDDEDARAHLIKFAVGRRVQLQLMDPLPLRTASAKEWEDFNKSLPKNVPDDEKSTNALTDLGHLQKEREPTLRLVYDFLSEYCHPNSSSRTFDFIRGMDDRTHRAQMSGGKISAGLFIIMGILKETLPTICSVLLESLAALDGARQPMMPLGKGLARDPFPGAMQCTDEFGRLFWIAPEDAEVPDIPGIKLSEDQARRVAAIYETFSEYGREGETLEDYIVDFGKEGDPEGQIQHWEKMLEVFRAELQLRGSVSTDVRKLLYVAILCSMDADTLDDLLKIDPRLTRLPNLERVFLTAKALGD